MDIGSTGATSFNYDSSIVDMYTDIPDAMTLQTGLVHTHHSMKAFISSTDFDEIVTNASHYNYYVSLVVSFDQDYVCKVAFPTEVKNTIKFEIKDSNGKSIPVKTEVVDHNLILSTLNVVFEQESTLDDWFIKKIADIKSAAVSATKKAVILLLLDRRKFIVSLLYQILLLYLFIRITVTMMIIINPNIMIQEEIGMKNIPVCQKDLPLPYFLYKRTLLLKSVKRT